jgi:putative component of toxin-antitoxin plasmid stabilization module
LIVQVASLEADFLGQPVLEEFAFDDAVPSKRRPLQEGNYGDVAPIGEGLSELRLFFGPYRRIFPQSS